MPRPLQIKIFMDSQASVIEEQINAWLASQTSVSIIKTETVVSGSGGSPQGVHGSSSPSGTSRLRPIANAPAFELPNTS
jgi:hypothetical protein